MKKLLVLGLAPLILTACSGDFFVDATSVHNGLVDISTEVASEEEEFYDVYFEIQDQESTEKLVAEFADVKAAAEKLDMYYNETDFPSFYENYVTVYQDSLKPALDDYILGFEELITAAGDTFDYDALEPMFENLDSLARDYQTADNLLTEELNANADM
jgi:hypothetical protein